MTLIIGMYYDNKKGALIASDSRIAEEYHILKPIQKIIPIQDIFIALSGTATASDMIVEKIGKNLKKTKDSTKIRDAVQQAYLDSKSAYIEGNKSLSTSKKFDCSGMFGFYSGKPELFRILDDEEEILSPAYDDILVNGQEDSYVRGILKTLYREEISKEEAIRNVIYSMMRVTEFNVGIDENIQIATIDEKGTKILNYEKERFNFQKPEFEEIKKQMKSVANLQRIALHTLINGREEDKSRLEQLLSEIDQ